MLISTCAGTKLQWRFASFVPAMQRPAWQVNMVTQCIHILVMAAVCACTPEVSCAEAAQQQLDATVFVQRSHRGLDD